MQIKMESKTVELDGKTLVIELGIDNDWFGQRDDYLHFATDWYIAGDNHHHEELYDFTDEGYEKASYGYDWLIFQAEKGELV